MIIEFILQKYHGEKLSLINEYLCLQKQGVSGPTSLQSMPVGPVQHV